MSASLRVVPPVPVDELDVERARAYLARCTDMDEVRDYADKAEAIARYLRSKNAADESAVFAATIALRAQRRLGELCRDGNWSEGGRPKTPSRVEAVSAPTLGDHGITHKDSHRWQALAAVPDDAFERELRACVEQKRQPSRAALLRLGEPTAEPEPFHFLTALGDLRDAIERPVKRALAEWPEEHRALVPGLLHKLANELEGAC